MLYFDRISVSKGMNVNKTSTSKYCDICHYWYFLNKSFKFQQNVCNRCHDLLMFMNLRDIAILNIRSSDYGCIISGVRKNEAIDIMQDTNFTKEGDKNLLSRIKMGKENFVFVDFEIEKNKFYRYKSHVSLINVDTETALVSNKVYYGEKKAINTLLITYIMIIKLSHNI